VKNFFGAGKKERSIDEGSGGYSWQNTLRFGVIVKIAGLVAVKPVLGHRSGR